MVRESATPVVCCGPLQIIDPWGRILAQCGEEEKAVIVADVDLRTLQEVRLSMPIQQHRRHDLYTNVQRSSQ